jgi:hypothetical protein
MWMDGLNKGDHVITVKAKNNGQETDVLSVTHTLYEGVEGAPLAPQAPPQPGGQQRGQLITPSGATPLDPGQITSLALNPGEEAKVNLTESDGKNSNQVFSLRNPSDKLTLFDIQLILPGAIFENGSGTSKMAVLSNKPPAYTFLPVAAGGDVRLNIDLTQGALRVEIYRIQMDTVQVTTNVSVVIAGGKNVLGVTHDPTTGEDKVSSFIGRIEVKPLAPGVSSFYISTGEMVQVSASGAGQISTIPLNQNPELRTYGLYVIGGCGCLGILLIVGIIVVTRITRAKKSKLPPQKPPHQVDVNPYAPAFGLPPTAMSTGGGTSTVSAAGRLIVSHGSASLPWVNIPPGGSIIGSDADCGLVVSDPTVSAHHTRVDFVNNVWVITDLNSSSGTWVNGVRISQQALRPGDQIKIGQTELGFQ